MPSIYFNQFANKLFLKSLNLRESFLEFEGQGFAKTDNKPEGGYVRWDCPANGLLSIVIKIVEGRLVNGRESCVVGDALIQKIKHLQLILKKNSLHNLLIPNLKVPILLNNDFPQSILHQSHQI